MKTYNLMGLLVLPLLCILHTPISAQVGDTAAAVATTVKAPNANAAFEYFDISLSDPAIYANEAFTISLTVKNTGGKEGKHEVRLLLKDETIPKGQRKHASQFVALRAGQTETVTFTFKAADLMEALENMPEIFVFLLGEYELGIGYEK